MILEPVMMNAGIIPPDAGYLAAIRELVHAEGALLIFDEVKTGFTTGPGRRHSAQRRGARHGLSGQGVRRRHRGRGDRRHPRGDVGDRRRPLRTSRHVQRQPVGDGGHPRDAHRRAHPRRPTRTSTSSPPGCAPRWKPSSPEHGFDWHVVVAAPRAASPSAGTGCASFATSCRSTPDSAICTG